MRRIGKLLAVTSGRFSPARFFSAGQQGCWFDPSDLSTMFQDSAGTTPVTAVAQPVGKILDKSGRGNHATQATSGARPLLSALFNLLTYTEQFDNAVWSKSSVSVVADAAVAPDGTTTADKLISAASGASYNISSSTATVLSGYSYTGVVHLKAGEIGTNVQVLLQSSAVWPGGTYPSVTVNLTTGAITGSSNVSASSITSLGNGWYRVTLTQTTSSAGSSGVRVAPTAGSAGDGTSGIYAWGADFRPSIDFAFLPPYQRVVTGATADYATAGFPNYLKFDGTDDNLVTANFDLSATDKITYFAGKTALSYTARGMLTELTNAAASGRFELEVPSSGLSGFIAASGGSTIVFTAGSTVAAPNTSVLTLSADIAGDSIALRRNGAALVSSASDQGTGNFSNLPLYIGSRGGSSLFFNGRLYQLIIRAVASTPTEIASAEAFVNSKAMAY